jgi:hypothetical protein
VGGNQPGQAVTAGDHDQAAGAAGQQRPDLVGAGRVVEQQQQPPAGRHRPVQAGRLLQVGRDQVHAQPVQQLAQRLDRAQLGGRRIATQVEVHLAVGELVGDLVGPVDGQGGLADPGHPGDHRHTQRGLGAGAALGKQGVELPQVVGAADEPGDVGGKLRRSDRRGGLRRRRAVDARRRGVQPQPRVAGQDRPLQPLQVRAGLQSQLVHQ